MINNVEKVTFSDDVIDEIIALTKAGKIAWSEIARNYYAQLDDISLYFYEGYENQNTQSEDLKLNIGNKHMEKRLYRLDKDYKSCRLLKLGNTIRQSIYDNDEEVQTQINQEVLLELKKYRTTCRTKR